MKRKILILDKMMMMNPIKFRVPQRTCVACFQVKPKMELIRLAAFTDGKIRPDYEGKEPGRGAYLCRNRACWELALKGDRKDRLARALRTNIAPENREALFEYGKNFPAV